jgi:hypothetical protein
MNPWLMGRSQVSSPRTYAKTVDWTISSIVSSVNAALAKVMTPIRNVWK